jgi:hypothetical protein
MNKSKIKAKLYWPIGAGMALNLIGSSVMRGLHILKIEC